MNQRSSVVIIVVLIAAFTTALAGAPPKIIRHVVERDEAVRAADYWTPERRASAIPMDARPMDLADPQAAEKVASGPKAIRGSAGPVSSTQESVDTQDYWTPENMMAISEESISSEVVPLASDFNRFQVPHNLYKGPRRKFPYVAVGRLFMRFDGVNYSCSAAVISPGRLVITARDCLYQASKGGFADLVSFYPGYNNGLNPNLGGGWIGGVFLTFDSGGQRFNIGIVQMRNFNNTGCKAKSGAPQIYTFTGFLGTFQGGTYPNNTAFVVFGYPAIEIPGPPAENFNGKFMNQCNTHQKGINKGGNAGTIEVGCDFTGGANGGPWIHTFKPDQQGQNNLLRSLTSHRLTGAANKLNIEGPQFQADNFGALLEAGITEPCD